VGGPEETTFRSEESIKDLEMGKGLNTLQSDSNRLDLLVLHTLGDREGRLATLPNKNQGKHSQGVGQRDGSNQNFEPFQPGVRIGGSVEPFPLEVKTAVFI